MTYTPTILRKGSSSLVAETLNEYWQLLFDGWRPDGAAPVVTRPPFTQEQETSLSATMAGGLIRAASPSKAAVTQGLYARTRPLSDAGAPIRPMAKDPTVPGRLWAIGVGSAQLGYTDNDGTTFTPKVAGLVAEQTIMQITFSNNFMWVSYSGSTDKAGSIWRSPKPDASGNGLAFTKVFDLSGLVNGPGGAAGSGTINSALRNSSFAVAPDESKAYILEYGNSNTSIALGTFSNALMGAGSDTMYITSGTSGFFKACYVGSTFTIPGAGAGGANLVTQLTEVLSAKKARFADVAQTAVTAATVTINTTQFGAGVCVGGPAIYVSSNAGGAAGSVTWSLGYRFDNAKHGHAVKIINGIPWVAVGDYPFPGSQAAGGAYPGPTHVGIWSATTSAATAFNSRHIATQAAPYVGINFLPMAVDGVASLVFESDGRYFHGPICLPTQSAVASSVVPRPLCYLPGAFTETMRGLTLTSEGNLMWLGTGESGAIGQSESVWIAAGPHYGNPVLLESVSSAGGGPFGNVGDPVESGDYIWLGTERIRKEKFKGQ